MSSGQFQVNMGEFSGPLDLLLTLIEERKMLVSDVSLSKVADDFVAFVKSHDSFPAGQAAHFILIAATLLLLKSRSLLPVLSLTEEEEENISDLEKRLSLYKIFRNAGRTLGQLDRRLFFGGLKRDISPLFSPSPDLGVESIQEAITAVLMRAPQQEKKREVSIKSVISLDEMMGNLASRLEQALSTTFKDFVGSPEDTREIVVGFLAVLELVKRGTLLVEQEGRFSDITLHYAGAPRAPRYD